MITTVVFDLDDTLYDEIDYCRSGFRAVARFLGKVAPPACSDDVFACLWRHFTAGNRTLRSNACWAWTQLAPLRSGSSSRQTRVRPSSRRSVC